MKNQVANVKKTKVCNICGLEKPINKFYKHKFTKDGFRFQCKICYNRSVRQYRLDNPEHCKQNDKKRRLKNRDKINQNNKLWRSRNPDYMKEYRLEKGDELSKKANKRRNIRLQLDVEYKIIKNLRNRIHYAIKTNKKAGHTIDFIMCSIPELKLHIEKQWLAGMTWKNWGRGVGKWNIDHIIPCSFFNMSDPVEQYMCFRWKNLQPLWWEDNRIKSDNIIKC